MVKKFANVSNADKPVSSIHNSRTSFPRHKKRITEFNVGDIVPVYLSKTLPSETTKLKMFSFYRMATPVVAVFDNLFLSSFFFYIPCCHTSVVPMSVVFLSYS